MLFDATTFAFERPVGRTIGFALGFSSPERLIELLVASFSPHHEGDEGDEGDTVGDERRSHILGG